MPPTKTQRWLDLLAFLTPRHYGVTRAQIMDGVPGYARSLEQGTNPESVRRTFERDKKELLALGIPLETVEGSGDDPEDQATYRLRSRDFYLPYLRILRAGAEGGGGADAGEPGETMEPERIRGLPLPPLELEADELRTVAEAARTIRDLPDVPFAAEAESAWRKLTFDLGPDWIGADGTQLVARGDEPPVQERTRALHDAMARGKTVRFSYTGAYRPGTESREVDPYGLLFRFNRWYLVGHDRTRDALRLFRVGRMEDLEVNPARPGSRDFTRPTDFTLEPWRQATPWSLPAEEVEVTEVTVRFDFPRSLLVDRAGLGELIEERPGGVTLRRFQLHQTDAFLRWLLSLQGEGRIVDPPELDEALGRMAAEVAALYSREAG